jgi:hypothetical protein
MSRNLALETATAWDDKAAGSQPDDVKADRSPEQWASYWKEQISIAEREHKPYWADCAKVADRYRNQAVAGKARRRFNVLYANIETLKGAIYAKSGKPDVRPRWSTNDKTARTASELIERSLVTAIDNRGHETAIGSTVLSGILAGRGVLRIDYEAHVVGVEPVLDQKPEAQAVTAQPVSGPVAPAAEDQAPVPFDGGPQPPQLPDGVVPVDPASQMQQPVAAPSPPQMTQQPAPIGHNGPPQMEEVVDQKIVKAFVRTNDFLHNAATNWSDVWWIAYRVRMTRDDMRDNGFKDADKIPLSWVPRNEKGEPDTQASDEVKRCELWEIWSKTHKKRFWIVIGYPTAPRVDDDPYGLEGFFNCPEPMMFHNSGSMIPFLEFFQYETMADDLEELHSRIAALTRALKRRGIRDKAIKGLEKLAKANDNEFVDVDSWQQLVQKGGLKGVFETEDIKPIAEVLTHLIQLAQAIEGKIDRITGIADIMRGASEGGAKTATEQQIKAQYGGVRIKSRQREVERFLRDVMRIEGEIIAEHFEPRTLQELTGIEVPPEVMELLRKDRARGMRIDIETDSTVFEDAAAEKEAVTEAVNTAMSLMEKGVAAVQQAPEFAEVIFESLGLLLRHIKGGRTMQDVIDRAKQQMMQRLQQAAQQPPPPDPEQVKAEAAMQQAQLKMQGDQQAAQMKLQADQAAQQAKMQAEAMAAQQKAENDRAMEEMRARVALQVEELKSSIMQQVEAAKLEQQAAFEREKMEFERYKHDTEMAIKRADMEIRELESRSRVHLEREKIANDNAHKQADRQMKDSHAMHKHALDASEQVEAAE